jgi:hypothetical protein
MLALTLAFSAISSRASTSKSFQAALDLRLARFVAAFDSFAKAYLRAISWA